MNKRIFFGVLCMLFAMVRSVYTHNDQLEVTVCTHLGAGFYAEFLKVVDAMVYFEKENLVRVIPNWTQEFFPYKDQPHENGWPLYFEPVIEISPCNDILQIRKMIVDQQHNALLHDKLWSSYDKLLAHRVMVHKKIKDHIKIKDTILQKLELFYQKNMAGCVCIGVHVRFANVHAQEVPGGRHPSLDEYTTEVNALIKRHQGVPLKIFLASDSHVVINHFKGRYPASMLVYIDAFRSQGSDDPHLIYNADYWVPRASEFHKKKPGYFGGETTLLDGLLLAKCDYLIHTMSNVSTFAAFMNPYIKSVYLPKRAQ